MISHMADEGVVEGRTTASDAQVLSGGEHVGAALRAVREARGLAVEDVAALTRIRPAYVQALESLRLRDLPSRPFVIGYVRAYAQALGLSGDAAVGRFKADDPDTNDALGPPGGIGRFSQRRLRPLILAGLLILSAIIVWNLIRRVTLQGEDRPRAPLVTAAPIAATPKGPMTLGSPLPAPVESNAPPAYLTPGLESELSAGLPEGAISEEDPTLLDLGETFSPRGAIYGPDASGRLVLQARRPTTLIVWGPGRTAWFARPLATGEAYRVEPFRGLSFETVEGGVIAVYFEGRARGALPAGLTPSMVLTTAAKR